MNGHSKSPLSVWSSQALRLASMPRLLAQVAG
jgi:hypothetical protein